MSWSARSDSSASIIASLVGVAGNLTLVGDADDVGFALADFQCIALLFEVPGISSIDAVEELWGISANAPVRLLLLPHAHSVIHLLFGWVVPVSLASILVVPFVESFSLILTVSLFLLSDGLLFLIFLLPVLLSLFSGHGSSLCPLSLPRLDHGDTFVVSIYAASHLQVSILVGGLSNGLSLTELSHAVALGDFGHLLQGFLTLFDVWSQVLLLHLPEIF